VLALLIVFKDDVEDAFPARGVESRMSFSGSALLFSRTMGSKAEGSTLSKMRPMSARRERENVGRRRAKGPKVKQI